MFVGDRDKRENTPGLVPVIPSHQGAGPPAQSNGCAVCGLDQNGDSILLCDGCDGEYHSYCLVPPLTEIPAGDFYCKRCTEANVAKQQKVVAEGLVAAPVPVVTISKVETDSSVALHTPAPAPYVPPNPGIHMKDSKYRGVSKVYMKGVKKPFVAKLWQGFKYLQLGTFGSEIEAAHAYDKAALMHFGNSAQLNFPHLHDDFVRPEIAFSVRTQNPSASEATSSSFSMEQNLSAGRGRGRSRGRGRGRGRGKRFQEPSDTDGMAAFIESKRRKMDGIDEITSFSSYKSPSSMDKKYLGVQVHRVYAHAQIHVNGKVVNLGTFPTAKDAAIAYDKAALKYFGGQDCSSEEDIVLNFPEKRDELLQHIAAEQQQKATGTLETPIYASRSAQNAQHNLSVKKLNLWISKLQRSVKLVEASQRVQWGIHSAVTKTEDIHEEPHTETAPSKSSLVKTEIFGSGPKINEEFTTSDQKLRQSKKEIERSIALMIEEIKVYVANAPTDSLFEPPPRSTPILDLMSTSRHLDLVGAINELAHFNIKGDSADPHSVVNGSFEDKLQAVVDHRTRLELSSRNEKQKLAHHIRDLVTTRSPWLTGDANNQVDTAENVPAQLDVLQNARYVKRKVLLSNKENRVVSNAQIDDMHGNVAEPTIQSAQAAYDTLSATFKDDSASTTEVKMLDHQIVPEGLADNSSASETIPTATLIKNDDGERAHEQVDDKKTQLFDSSNDDAAVQIVTGMNDLPENEVTEDNSSQSIVDDYSSNNMEVKVECPEVKMPAQENTTVDSKVDVFEEGTIIMETFTTKVAADKVEVANAGIDKLDSGLSGPIPGISSSTTSTISGDDGVVKRELTAMVEDVADSASLKLEEAPPNDKYYWQYCLAIQAPLTKSSNARNVWRLLPLLSTTEVGDSFDDLFLTEKEVLEMEVSEEDVCSFFASDDKDSSWMKHLHQLQTEENHVRQRIQRETNHQHALQGILKIEQDRLSEMSLAYAETMSKLNTKTALTLKTYSRVSQDAKLVNLIQHSFNPILIDLLDKCEDALFTCFQKLSRRFEDFSEEFEHYRSALLSFMEYSKEQTMTEEGNASPQDASDLSMDNCVTIKSENIAKAVGEAVVAVRHPASGDADKLVDEGEVAVFEEGDGVSELDDSIGLRNAYVSFYVSEMEALWKERSSSLEMLQAIQRSLLHASLEAETSTETSVEPEMWKSYVAKRKPSESEDVEMTAGDIEADNKSSDSTGTDAQVNVKADDECKDSAGAEVSVNANAADVVTSLMKNKPIIAKEALKFENGKEAQESVIDVCVRTDDVPCKIEINQGSSEFSLKVKSLQQEVSGKFRREQELREAIEFCLAQWQRIEWPAELNSMFFKPTITTMLGASSVIKSELMKSNFDHDEKKSNNVSSLSVMDELKRIMIDLTQDQVAPVPPPVEPTTLVLYHPVFINHQTPKNHPECPERIDRVVNILNSLIKRHRETLKLDRLSMSPDELCPPETTLLMVHSPTYLRQLKERSIEAGLQPASSPSASASSPSSRALVFESDSGISDETSSCGDRRKKGRTLLAGAFGAASLEQNGIELDTFVSSKSWDVARAAAGTVCHAVDQVVRKEYHNAVCLVRPPGHHVGRHGRPQNAPSSGFCLLNNVVIGATHARLYPWIRKIAVLDWDIHHGNGTEELLQDDPDAFFASIHLYSSGKYFPGTGKSCETGNRVNVALENTGAGSGSMAFRAALELKVLPAMRAFHPDIIFISAGFDGHRDDIIGGVAAVNNPNVPAGYVEEDYAWATLEVLKLAADVCDGRIVSVLEGGYDVRCETNSLAKSVAAHVAAIAAYEAARRMSGASVSIDVEMKDEEPSAFSGLNTSPLGDIGIKSEHESETKPVSLLEKLLSTDLDNANVIDDEDHDDEISQESPSGEDESIDMEDENTGEEEDDTNATMADAAKLSYHENGAMDVDDC
ncbi:hypothetical protein CCR75_003542 [Bremia lactucae]|uniref:Histone deacetylase n=1 Tax=Bremia lactucae TaxID=4779 RepID=A0A976IGK1_BRELC|nr:hypothetical protein CCR75_003542 [Bremia lactucae]